MWQELIYRTLILTNIVTTGDLWFDRDDRTILARDELELWQGARERTLVTQTAVDTNTVSYTNAVWTWTADDGTDTWTYSEWHPATTNWMKYTNTYKMGSMDTETWSFTNENTTVVAVPETLDVYKWQLPGTNRQQFIQGAWTNVTVSGFDNSAGDVDFTEFNGDYVFSSRTNLVDPDGDGLTLIDSKLFGGPEWPDSQEEGDFFQHGYLVDVYTNDSYFLAIYDVPGWLTEPTGAGLVDYGYIYRGSGAVLGELDWEDNAIYKPRLDPIQGTNEWFETPGPYKQPDKERDHGVVSVSGEIPGMRRGLYSFDVDMRRNAIDDIISQRKFKLITTACRSIFDNNIYVDHAAATNGGFIQSETIPELVLTNVIDRLSIDFPLTDDYLTNTLVQTTNYTTRYMMFNYAKWSHTDRPGASKLHNWESPYRGSVKSNDGTPATPTPAWATWSTNVFYGIGYSTSATLDDASSWSTAKTRAEANAGYGDSETMTDFSGRFDVRTDGIIRLTYGAQAEAGTNYQYTAIFCSKQGQSEVSGLNENIDKNISFWYVVGDNEYIDEAGGVELGFAYDDYSTGYVEDRFNKGGGDTYDIGYVAAYTSAVYGLHTIPSPWVGQPTGVTAGVRHEAYRGHCVDTLQMDQLWNDTNSNYFVFLGRGTTWADAQFRAPFNQTTATRDDGLPVAGTYGKWDLDVSFFTSNYFESVGEWRTAYMVHTNSDEVAGNSDGYVVVGKYDNGGLATGAQRAFDSNDTAMTDTNDMQRFSTNQAIVTGIATSAWLAVGFTNDVYTSFPEWCDEPPANVADFERSKGYQGTNGDMILKWDFIYCTNSI